ncbi:hypothetical protein NQ036_03755 [Brevibacterium sp. 91QC2O2]|uniref:hypothetical protein n=1 Tax=Brevibacterium TaxID=1696 RepID=UPI00211CCE4F|nr:MULTISPECIES: hypothetical protein [unclassified Brevibacterium]MCQ9367362.1 hypothetical protein [Brevibacterium sp. 91QC2O2]MCQ9384625.1 hypothetical protein [Brevibacterium sp. 68QC2CO]
MSEKETLKGYLAERHRIAAAATPGEWKADVDGEFGILPGIIPDDTHYGVGSAADIRAIADARAALPHLLTALEGVLQVHQPIEAVDELGRTKRPIRVCAGCGTDSGQWQLYPCRTVRPICAALGVDPNERS